MLSSRDLRYYRLALHVAGWSKDPSTKVGAVLVGRDPRKLAVGYNGFPPGFGDLPERLVDRETKHKYTMHAERNVLDNAEFDARGATLYVTHFPCIECAKSIVSRGIRRVVSPPPTDREPWCKDTMFTLVLFDECGVEVEEVSDAEAR